MELCGPAGTAPLRGLSDLDRVLVSYDRVYDNEHMTVYDRFDGSVIRSGHMVGFPYGVRLLEKVDFGEFVDWCCAYYARETRRQVFSVLREAVNVLRNPSMASKYKGLPKSRRRKIMFTIYAVLKWLREVKHVKYPFSTTIVRRMLGLEKEPPKLLEYVEEEPIVKQAEEIMAKIVKLGEKSVYRLAGETGFFTGLRWPEIRYLINNYKDLKKLHHKEAIIVEINYLRKSKNAYVTIVPEKLHEKLLENTKQLGYNADKELRDTYGIKFSILRKAHLAICSTTMNELEIDLLQGRMSPKLPEILSEITREHYVKHLRKIAEKYLQAYQPYINKYLR